MILLAVSLVILYLQRCNALVLLGAMLVIPLNYLETLAD